MCDQHSEAVGRLFFFSLTSLSVSTLALLLSKHIQFEWTVKILGTHCKHVFEPWCKHGGSSSDADTTCFALYNKCTREVALKSEWNIFVPTFKYIISTGSRHRKRGLQMNLLFEMLWPLTGPTTVVLTIPLINNNSFQQQFDKLPQISATLS